LPVRITVGPVDKTLMVFGPRAWRRELSGHRGPTEPQSFVSVPITYENAFGGATSKRNPMGRGIESEDLPRIEDPRRLVISPGDNIHPAGFGPLAAGWQPRADVVGTYDERWLKERWPWFPEDFDYGYFNAAPRDQQVEGFFNGDEGLVFGNLHPEHEIYRTRLPGRRVRCFFHESETDGQQRSREVPLKLDTLWIDLNTEKMVLVWRGNIPVRTIKMKEVDKILAWTELLSEPRRPDSYGQVFLAERQRAEDAEFEVESPEEAAAAAARDAAADENGRRSLI
jgi:hypothetical protein